MPDSSLLIWRERIMAVHDGNADKVVLITGGASGIGFGTVEYLLEQGGYIPVSFSRGEAHNNAAKEKLGAKADRVLFLQGDISSEDDCARLFEEIERRYGHLDGLVNCAGIIKLGGIEEQSLAEWKKALDVNLTGMFLMTKTMLPLLKKGKNASVVNLSSMAADRVGGSIAYSAAKAGVEAFTKYAAKELGKYNIRVNCVAPAAVYTDIYITSGDYTQEGYDKWSEEKAVLYPLGRIGYPKKDLAPTIEFLLSDKCTWTTGGRFLVDGGISI